MRFIGDVRARDTADLIRTRIQRHSAWAFRFNDNSSLCIETTKEKYFYNKLFNDKYVNSYMVQILRHIIEK